MLLLIKKLFSCHLFYFSISHTIVPIHMLVDHIDTIKVTLYSLRPRTQERFGRSDSTAPHRRLLDLVIAV